MNTRTRGHTARNRPRGQALVEMALGFGVILFIVIGALNIAHAAIVTNGLNQAARESAHTAAISGNDRTRATEAATTVLQTIPGFDERKATITITCARTPCRRYDRITVRVAYVGPPLARLAPIFTTLTAEAQAIRASERDQQ